VSCSLPSPGVVECLFAGSLQAYEWLTAEIHVHATPGAQEHETGEVTVSGGEAAGGAIVFGTSSAQHLTVGGTPVAFGVEEYEMLAANEDGSPDTQAGSHPFGLRRRCC
jgi:hypothetical protein